LIENKKEKRNEWLMIIISYRCSINIKRHILCFDYAMYSSDQFVLNFLIINLLWIKRKKKKDKTNDNKLKTYTVLSEGKIRRRISAN